MIQKITVKENNKPTKPGVYLYRLKGRFDLKVVEILEENGKLVAVDEEHGTYELDSFVSDLLWSDQIEVKVVLTEKTEDEKYYS